MTASMVDRKTRVRPRGLPAWGLVVVALLVLCRPAPGLANEFDASLGVMAYDLDVSITINGIHLDTITGGKFQGVRLFLMDSPRIKEMTPDMAAQYKSLFCLREGENTMEVSFKATTQDELSGRLTITVESGNYQVPVLEYIQGPEAREGQAKGTFTIYSEQPAGFATTVLK